jgi:hypothetical protein
MTETSALAPQTADSEILPRGWTLGIPAALGLALLAWLTVSFIALWPQFSQPAASDANLVTPRGPIAVQFTAPDRSAAEVRALSAIEAAAARFGVRARSTRPQPTTRPDAIVVRTDWIGREDRIYRALEALTRGSTPLVVTQMTWRMGLDGEANLNLEVSGLWVAGADESLPSPDAAQTEQPAAAPEAKQ